MSTFATRRPVSASMREIVPSGLIAHTAPAPTTIPGRPQLAKASPPDSLTLCVVLYVLGSTRSTRLVPLPPCLVRLPIQRAPSPAAISVGKPRGLKVPVTRFVAGSMRVTTARSVLRTQIAPSPSATLLGAVPDSISALTLASLPARAAIPLPICATVLRGSSSELVMTAAAAAAATRTSPPARTTLRRRSILRRTRGLRTPGTGGGRAASISAVHVS